MMKLLHFVRNVASPDRDRRYYASKLFGEFLTGDFRISWHQLDWWEDPEFSRYLRRFGELDGMNTHRRWMLWQLIRMTGHVPGDTAECGVYRGASSWLIAAFARQSVEQPKQHHMFDSYEGLSQPGPLDGGHWVKGALSAGEDIVADNLAPFRDILHFHKGWIPEKFPDVADRRFSFVHVDVDLFEPTRDSIHFFYERLNPGAVFLCDDYACTTCPGATRAVDDFLKDKPEKMIGLDGGGGFFVKGQQVQAPVSLMLDGGGGGR